MFSPEVPSSLNHCPLSDTRNTAISIRLSLLSSPLFMKQNLSREKKTPTSNQHTTLQPSNRRLAIWEPFIPCRQDRPFLRCLSCIREQGDPIRTNKNYRLQQANVRHGHSFYFYFLTLSFPLPWQCYLLL